MATSRRPSYLKRQKEQARQARANEKRTARLERKRNGGGPEMGSLEELGITDAAGGVVGLGEDIAADEADEAEETDEPGRA